MTFIRQQYLPRQNVDYSAAYDCLSAEQRVNVDTIAARLQAEHTKWTEEKTGRPNTGMGVKGYHELAICLLNWTYKTREGRRRMLEGV